MSNVERNSELGRMFQKMGYNDGREIGMDKLSRQSDKLANSMEELSNSM